MPSEFRMLGAVRQPEAGASSTGASIATNMPFEQQQTITGSTEQIAEAAMPRSAGILGPGRNCWRLEHVRRAAVLVDGACYFERLEQVLRQARRQVLIVGWDFDWRISLRPDGTPEAEQLGPFLASLARARSELEISILIWSIAVLHGSSAPKALLWEDPWLEPPNIRLKLDTRHPIYGAHHQKLVVVDDVVAFNGGIDLTAERWDMQGHPVHDPRRIDPDGKAYMPVHDLQMIIEGDGARALGEVARWRWRRATGETIEPCAGQSDPWPGTLDPDFTDIPIAIARTAPAWGGDEPVHEAAALLHDIVRTARRCLYIEAQYLANFRVGELMIECLERPDGPEIVIIVTREARGMVEQFAMASNRDRLVRRLMRADRHDRLRVYFPTVTDEGEVQDVLIHAKLIIADDAILRLGSSNLNNRSQGLDSECDLAIEATDAKTRQAITDLRAKLLSEHLGITPAAFNERLARSDSLIETIEALNGDGRLRRIDIDADKGPTRPVFGTRLMDPRKPFEPIWWLRRKMGF
jgi:phosphatidylserine/phosphatidylglycerophosphate/cardiolipin synthase-like enzyme